MEPKRPKHHLNPSWKRPKNATKPQGIQKKKKKIASSITNLQAAKTLRNRKQTTGETLSTEPSKNKKCPQ